MKSSTITIALLLFSLKSFNQPSLSVSELIIQKLHTEISKTHPDSENLRVNDSITDLFEKSLQLPGAFEYPFDSLKFMGKILSDDKKVRIFSWNVPLSDGTQHYSGFILHKTEGTNYNLTRLNDKSNQITSPESADLSADNWYGCLIYDIIDTKYSGETWYTLLGYDPDNIFTTKKLIDILFFSNDIPLFGKPVFLQKKRTLKRVIFEYSSRVQMTLKWDSRLNMIVIDHLAPSSPAYQGNFRYYGPDFSYDGFKFEKGLWEFHEDIDARGR